MVVFIVLLLMYTYLNKDFFLVLCITVIIRLKFKVIFSFDFRVKCGLVCDLSVRFITLCCNIPVSTLISLIHSCLFNRSDTEVSKYNFVIRYVAE